MDSHAVETAFHEQGYAILPNLLPPDVVAGARAAMDRLVEQAAATLRAADPALDPYEELPFETRLYALFRGRVDQAPKSFRRELHLPELYGVFFCPVLLDVVERLIGPEIRLYPNYTARPKFPDWAGTLVLWHQDGGYTATGAGDAAASLRMVNVWSPLVPARVSNGCMAFVPGTHRLGVVPHVARDHYLEIAPEMLAAHTAAAVPIELDPGDVVLFHNLLFHRGLPNTSSGIRWSLDWRYQDATQPTLRAEHGHLARSRANPSGIVRDPAHWASLSFS